MATTERPLCVSQLSVESGVCVIGFFVAFSPIVLVVHKEQGPALMGVVQGGADFVYAPMQTEKVYTPGEAAHQVIPGEGPDLTT